MATSTYKAKELHVPQEVYELLDSFVDKNGHSFTSSLEQDGKLHERKAAAIAVCFATSMIQMLDIQRELIAKDPEIKKALMPNGKISNPHIFSHIMVGIGLSYMFGNFKWAGLVDGHIPALVPTIGVEPSDYKTITFRNGKKADAEEVTQHLFEHMESEEIHKLYKTVMRYNIITGSYEFKSKSSFVMALLSIFRMIDEHISDANHYKK